MANHFPNDPYYPLAGNEWHEEDSEEGYEADSEGETEEEFTNSHDSNPIPSSDNSIWDGSVTDTDESEILSEQEFLHLMTRAHRDFTPRVTPTPPSWATQLHSWSQEQGFTRPLGTSPAYFDISTSTTADRALPVMIGRVSNLDARVEDIGRQLANATITATNSITQMHRIAAYRHYDQEEIRELRLELVTARSVIDTLHERLTMCEQRVITAEASAATREEEARIATRSAAEMSARLAHHYGI